jgi:hypothetical protein
MSKGRCVKWSKGRTRCVRRAKSLGGGLGKARGKARKKPRCPKGIVKSGSRKGQCRKVRRPRRS